MDVVSGGDTWYRPARELLLSARELQRSLQREDSFKQKVRLRVLTVGAIGAASIEASSHAFMAGVLAATSGLKSLTCLVLQGVFLGVWALNLWLQSQTLVKTPLQWFSFWMLQGSLVFSNPSQWFSQWKLWGRMLHSMGVFANSAASLAYKLSDNVNDFASWDITMMHLKRMSQLTLFALSCFRYSLIYPERVISNYGRLVEPWPLELTPVEAVIHCMKNHKVLTTVVTVAAVAWTTHVLTPGRQERSAAVAEGSKLLFKGTVYVLTKTGEYAWWALDETVGDFLRWIFNTANEETRNRFARAGEQAANAFINMTKNNGDVGSRIDSLGERLDNLTAVLQAIAYNYLRHAEKAPQGDAGYQGGGEDQCVPWAQELTLSKGMSHAE